LTVKKPREARLTGRLTISVIRFFGEVVALLVLVVVLARHGPVCLVMPVGLFFCQWREITSDGEKVQKIDIYYNFVGIIDQAKESRTVAYHWVEGMI